MTHTQSNRHLFLSAAALAVTGATDPATAGPPLICHPVEIGVAASLPWGKDSKGFDADKGYDVRRLVDDTLALLNSQMGVLVRMETLRRATIYAHDQREVAVRLLERLEARVLEAEATARPDGLAWFDAGYLLQCYAQHDMLPDGQSAAASGFAWAEKGLRLRGADAEMEFALALMTQHVRTTDGRWEPHPDHAAHLRRALAGATERSALATNLLQRFGEKGETLAAMRTRYGSRG